MEKTKGSTQATEFEQLDHPKSATQRGTVAGVASQALENFKTAFSNCTQAHVVVPIASLLVAMAGIALLKAGRETGFVLAMGGLATANGAMAGLGPDEIDPDSLEPKDEEETMQVEDYQNYIWASKVLRLGASLLVALAAANLIFRDPMTYKKGLTSAMGGTVSAVALLALTPSKVSPLISDRPATAVEKRD
jgi:hypothetical protein